MKIKEFTNGNFHWVDVINPNRADLDNVARRFSLPAHLVQDCMEPEHLPKFEKVDGTSFIILRAFDPAADFKSDTIQALTRKVAIFFGENFVVSFHRKEQPYVQHVFESWEKLAHLPSGSSHRITAELVLQVAKSYGPGVESALERFERFEEEVFTLGHKLKLKQSYLLKRRVTIMRRMLRLMGESLGMMIIEASRETRPLFKNAREYIDKQIFQLDELLDNLSGLVSLQISLVSQKTNEASHRTNEVMRILTIFSVFFMPLNFLTGIYGMNFIHLPGLDSTYALPLILGAMLTVALLFYFWFRRKGWLQG